MLLSVLPCQDESMLMSSPSVSLIKIVVCCILPDSWSFQYQKTVSAINTLLLQKEVLSEKYSM